jgi:hypothetical protein
MKTMPQQKCHASFGGVDPNCGIQRYVLPVQVVTMTIYSPVGITMKIYPPVFTPLPCRWRFLQTAATNYETTRRHIEKDSFLQRHRLKNHKYYNYDRI